MIKFWLTGVLLLVAPFSILGQGSLTPPAGPPGALAVWSDSGLGEFPPDAGATTTKVLSWPSADRKFIRAISSILLQP